jgi:hypothetical protein
LKKSAPSVAKQVAEKLANPGRMKENHPSGAKALLILLALSAPFDRLRAGFEAVSFQNSGSG